MKRWNGWGEERIAYPLPDSALSYLQKQIGPGEPSPDASYSEVVARVPAARLPPLPSITTEAGERLRHARGQSLPDWVALRSGSIKSFPDGIAYPASDQEVRTLFDYAKRDSVCLIPYGGGTSVVGHINPPPDGPACLTLDLSRLNRLLELNETSRLATFEAGVRGPDLERQLREHGFTLGHFPQSFEFSTLGGWIATRSSGQQSYYYGRIEDLFAGGHVETPAGPLDLLPSPASAAGPDLRHAILGCEGRFGVLTRAVLRVRPLPEVEGFYGVFFRDFETGTAAVREMAQSGLPLSMLRLSDPVETETFLALSGKARLAAWARRGLTLVGYAQACLFLFGVTGNARPAGLARDQAYAVARAHRGLPAGELAGELWRKSRFLTPYLRNMLWEHGYALDTLETAVPWSAVLPAAAAIKGALQAVQEARGERLLTFAHLSHVYKDGASIYVTYLFRRAADPHETLRRWEAMKSAASRAILEQGGTISHQHGVGRDHAAYLEAEKGRLGIEMLRSIGRACDPSGLLNPGVMY